MKYKLPEGRREYDLVYCTATASHIVYADGSLGHFDWSIEFVQDKPDDFDPHEEIRLVIDPIGIVLSISWRPFKPLPKTQSRIAGLSSVMHKLAEISGEPALAQYFGIGHIPPEAIEKIEE